MNTFFRHSIAEISAFIEQAGIELVDWFCSGLETTYSGNQLSCNDTLTHISGVDAMGIEMQGLASGDADNRYCDGPSPTPSPEKPEILSAKRCHGHTKSPARL